MAYKNLLESIGNTPIIKIETDYPPTILAKLEYLNPGGSIKDRSSLYMIEDAEKNGLLKPGGTIIDASSGNQGIATAMIGAAKGYKVIITVSEKISKEKLDTIRAYGAKVVMCPATDFLEDPESYHSKAVEIHKNTPNSFMPNQYFNKKNSEAHYNSLGPEIWKQTNGKVTHLFAAAGTTGHVCGSGKFLKEMNPEIKVIALDSENSWYSTHGKPKPYKLEGIGMDFSSPIFEKEIVDDVIPVSDKNAISTLKKLANEHGLLLGPSSGAVAHGAFEYAKKLNPENIVVMVFGDSGRAYLTKEFYSQ